MAAAWAGLDVKGGGVRASLHDFPVGKHVGRGSPKPTRCGREKWPALGGGVLGKIRRFV